MRRNLLIRSPSEHFATVRVSGGRVRGAPPGTTRRRTHAWEAAASTGAGQGGLGLALDEDRCIQILHESGFLPSGPGFGLVSFFQIPDGLNAEELERFLREDGAETRGFRGAQNHGGPASASLRAVP